MSVFHHFVSFHISQDYLVKMNPHFVSSPSDLISRNITESVTFLTDLSYFIFQRLKLHNRYYNDVG